MFFKSFTYSSFIILRQSEVYYNQSVRSIILCQNLKYRKIEQDLNLNATKDNEEINKKKRPKTAPIPKITLISPDNNLSIVTLDEASKVSVRRGLKLVKVIDFDTKTQRPVFKMMTTTQFLKDDSKFKRLNNEENKFNELKGEKTAIISSRIGKSDLESKVNHFRKWLLKCYEVRITITGDSSNEIADNIIKMTEGFSRVVQKRQKGDSIKFQLLPPKQTK
ncbi:uncharacterized protein LOC126902706 [Daktulosphaira vitifoliae]|uniref:uncharacterized protein LOC126902706 n=1 Tax=Daktulosphaira vitifoliae TaxID=58002 RepID=UPI0021A97B31|nr:uncharacterized protein LOC126902706 [Daktulosphaira vitifoliae]